MKKVKANKVIKHLAGDPGYIVPAGKTAQVTCHSTDFSYEKIYVNNQDYGYVGYYSSYQFNPPKTLFLDENDKIHSGADMRFNIIEESK